MRGFANQINKRKEARVKLVEMSNKLTGYPVWKIYFVDHKNMPLGESIVPHYL